MNSISLSHGRQVRSLCAATVKLVGTAAQRDSWAAAEAVAASVEASNTFDVSVLIMITA